MATRKVKIGKILIGGGNPVRVQSMCNTKTYQIGETVKQIRKLEQAGCELVRVAVPDEESAKAISSIIKKIQIPLIADIHFDYKLALLAIENGAAKIRINPGNVGGFDKTLTIIKKAKQKNIPIRIGVNAGSLPAKAIKKFGGPTAEAMVSTVLEYIDFFEQQKFKNLVVSLKHSDTKETIKAYELISKKTDYPLHLGVTEAGTFLTGTIKSSIALGALLYQGIGDTIRVSLSDDPVKEVEVGFKILEALNLRQQSVTVISCPTCARTSINVVKLANFIEDKTKTIKKPIKVAVMGCLVNGPGEAKEADIGVCGMEKEPGYLMVFKKSKLVKKIKEEKAAAEIIRFIRKKHA